MRVTNVFVNCCCYTIEINCIFFEKDNKFQQDNSETFHGKRAKVKVKCTLFYKYSIKFHFYFLIKLLNT